MTRRDRLPARRPVGDYLDALDRNEVATPPSNGSWVGKALAEQAAAVRDIAKAIADAGVFQVSEVLAEHGLLEGRLDIRDIVALHPVITEIAARLIHERMIERLGNVQRDPPVMKEVAVSVLLREYGR